MSNVNQIYPWPAGVPFPGEYAPLFPTSRDPIHWQLHGALSGRYRIVVDRESDEFAIGDDYYPVRARSPRYRLVEDQSMTHPAVLDWEGHRDPVCASLRRELREYAYKPGFEMEVPPPRASAGFRGVEYLLRMTMLVPDSRRRDMRMSPVVSMCIIDAKLLDGSIRAYAEGRAKLFERIVWTQLRDLEMHELDEWFRYRGKLVDDPHAPKVRVTKVVE
jgi:hypothetical protein